MHLSIASECAHPDFQCDVNSWMSAAVQMGFLIVMLFLVQAQIQSMLPFAVKFCISPVISWSFFYYASLLSYFVPFVQYFLGIATSNRELNLSFQEHSIAKK